MLINKKFFLIISMKTRYSSLVIIAIIFSIAMVVPFDMTQTADAAKATGVKNQQYGQATSTKVCGDRLCTPEDFRQDGTKKEIAPTTTPSINYNTAMSKMERLFDLHRMQLLSAWDSMSHSEKSHMMKMFDKMYEKMQSMTFEEHMKHMSSMMDGKHDLKDKHGMKEDHSMKDKHGDSGCSCGEGEHGCSCGEGEPSMACESDKEVCTCSEDGVCNCGEGCTCASCN